MEHPEITSLEKAANDLFNYAIERDDIKWLAQSLPETHNALKSAVEYELQILKIVSVGWSLFFYMDNSPRKNLMSEAYWHKVHEFSKSLSEALDYMTGTDVDYFQVLKDRLDMYVQALSDKQNAAEPAAVIGPAFAKNCKSADDLFVRLTGSKMFASALQSVQEYLNATEKTYDA